MQKNFYALSKEAHFEEQELLQISELCKENTPQALGIYSVELEALHQQVKEVECSIRSELMEFSVLEQSQQQLESQYQECLEREFLYYQENNLLATQSKELQEDLHSITGDTERNLKHFDMLVQLNVVNDAFYIWYAGPYGTINNFRMGNTAIKPIESNELNAALGEAALAVHTIASRCGVDFKTHSINPVGSFSKIIRLEDRSKTSYPLYIDQGSFSFFPKRNFNCALTGFLYCVNELGEYVASYDPTMSMPYKINLQELNIGDIPFSYGVDDEIWTRSLKFLLSNIKWIIAWYSKHGKSLSVTSSTTSMI